MDIVLRWEGACYMLIGLKEVGQRNNNSADQEKIGKKNQHMHLCKAQDTFWSFS